MHKDIITDKANIKIAMNKLQSTSKRCLVVVDKKLKLLGTLSDGDIRRSLLKGSSLKSSIKNIYNKKPYTVNENELHNYNHQIKVKELDLIPVINNNKKLIKIIFKNQILSTNKSNELRDIPVFIMAGGKGTRMVPFTKILPKPLLPINETTVIESIIQKYNNYGCKNFFLSLNYKAKLLQNYIEETKLNKIKINFIHEKIPLGTAGSIYYIKNKVNKSFFLCNCDTLIDTDFSDVYDFHRKNNFDITIIAAMKNTSLPYGVCKFDENNNLIKIEEKPTAQLIVNTGSYVLSKKIPKLIKSKSKMINMDELIKLAKKKNFKIGVYPIESRLWQDVGEWEEYRRTLRIIKKS